MAEILVVSRVEHLSEYRDIAKQYNAAFEINDFFGPDILDDDERQKEIINIYKETGIPAKSTMHGAFFDISVFSQDAKIRELSKCRMKQSMETAKLLGVRAVVFHTNYNPCLTDIRYTENVIEKTSQYIEELLKCYPNIHIYLENVFDKSPDILIRVADNLREYENFGVCLDWAHVNIYGGDLKEWADKLSPYIKHIHLNDNDLVSDLHLAIGDGQIDWKYFKECFEDCFERCTILVETIEPDNQRKSLEYLKKLFGNGGE